MKKYTITEELNKYLGHLEDIQSQVRKLKSFDKINDNNYEEFIEEFEYFESLLNDRRYHKMIPDKYFDIFESFEDNELSDAEHYKKENEYNYYKYEMGYNRNQLMCMFCNDY